MPISNDPLFLPVASLIHQTARITAKARRNLATLRIETKGDDSPVTEADHASEAALTTGLQIILPGSKVLGEETCPPGTGWQSPLIKSRGNIWTVDPIDGTRPFIKGGEYGIMVALRQNRKTTAAWIYYPVTKDMLFASAQDIHAKYITHFGAARQNVRDITQIPSLETAHIKLEYYPLKNKIPEKYRLKKLFGKAEECICIATATRSLILRGDTAVISEHVLTPWDDVPTRFIAAKAGAPAARDISGRLFRDGSESNILAPTRSVMQQILSSIRAASV